MKDPMMQLDEGFRLLEISYEKAVSYFRGCGRDKRLAARASSGTAGEARALISIGRAKPRALF